MDDGTNRGIEYPPPPTMVLNIPQFSHHMSYTHSGWDHGIEIIPVQTTHPWVNRGMENTPVQSCGLCLQCVEPWCSVMWTMLAVCGTMVFSHLGYTCSVCSHGIHLPFLYISSFGYTMCLHCTYLETGICTYLETALVKEITFLYF